MHLLINTCKHLANKDAGSLFARPSVVFYVSEAIKQDSLHIGIEDAELGITD